MIIYSVIIYTQNHKYEPFDENKLVDISTSKKLIKKVFQFINGVKA